MATKASEQSASALAHEWIASLESALESVTADVNALSRALGTRAAAGSGANAVELSKRLCESAVVLRTKNDKLVTFMNTAPPSLEILDSVEKALDARDAALDAFEDALERNCGIEPVGKSDSEYALVDDGTSTMHGRAAVGLARRADAPHPALSTPAAGGMPTDLPPPMSAQARPRTPSPAPSREQSLPATPTLADFGISEAALDGIMNPDFLMTGLGTSRSAKTTRTIFPQAGMAHASEMQAKEPVDTAWRTKAGDSSTFSGMTGLTSMYGSRGGALEDSSSAMEGREDEEDENDVTYDETVHKAMAEMGIETPNAIRGRFGVRSPVAFALRGLDGSPLYSEETPRVQTRKSAPHRAVVQGYDQLPEFLKAKIAQQDLVNASEAVESGGPGKVYATEELNAIFTKAVPNVAPNYVILALTKLKVVALQRGEKSGEQVYHLVV